MKKIFKFTAILLFSTNLIAQVDRSIRPQPSEAPKINIKDSEVFTMANGITVILSENHKLPRVSFRLTMDSDPMFEGNKAGLSSMAGQLIMSGTTNRSKDQLDNEIDYIGASIYADESSIGLSCLTKHLDKGLELMSDILFNANFPDAEFERIKKQNESSLLSAKSSPDQMARNATKKVNFPNHPYGDVMTEASLNSISKEDVKDYYKRVFTPNGSYLVIVGDITREKAEQIVNATFGKWQGENKFTSNYNEGNFNKGNRVIFVKKPGAVQSTVTVTFPMKIKAGDPNQISLSVLNGILGSSGFGARLMQNLREDKAYTYGCYSSVNVKEHGSWFTASGNFRNEVTDSAITQILYELDRITNDYVSDEELFLTKSGMAGSFARSLESPQTIARFALNIIKNKLPKDYYQTYLQKLDAVDKETVLLMAQTYFTAKNCNIIVVGNEEILEKLKVFDADGKIEMLDAFGNEFKDMKPSSISKDELIEKYILTTTKSASMKEAIKKIDKVKSMKQEVDLTAAQMPMTIKMTTYFVAPNKESMKMEMQGMMVQKQYFDGTKGGSISMQTGKTELTEDEIADKKKMYGLFPELNYSKSNVDYELLGIENQNGKDLFVLKVKTNKMSTFDYFTADFQKVKSVNVAEEGEATSIFSDFKEVNGILFPHQTTLMIGEMALNGEVKNIEINGKIEATVFE
jgi:zinc protease